MPVLLRVPHRSRRQDRPLLTPFLYSASRRRFPSPNPDGSAAAWPLWLTGNPPGSTETTMGTILYTTDPNATTGFREATFEELIAGARHALAIRVRKGAVMASPNAARDYLTMRLAPRDHEVFTILFLDSRHRLIDCLEIFRGTIDGASVHPREVGQGSARPERRRRDPEPQPPERRRRAQPGGRTHHAAPARGAGAHRRTRARSPDRRRQRRGLPGRTGSALNKGASAPFLLRLLYEKKSSCRGLPRLRQRVSASCGMVEALRSVLHEERRSFEEQSLPVW